MERRLYFKGNAPLLRQQLLRGGYEQVSMRLFRRRAATSPSAPVYRCQHDGMVGLGCGPRSYTRALHYSGPYAVGARGVRAILDEYLARDDRAFGLADFGIRLDPEDQRRRYVIQSLLQRPGIDRADYVARFGADVLTDLPELADLPEEGLAEADDTRFGLTEAGIERSDAIGPWLYSAKVRSRMREYRWR